MSLADQLTVARALAVPFVIVLYAWHFSGHAYWATAIFIAAMATDQFDGWLARRQGRTSELGSLLDPMADKLLTLSTLVVLVGEGVLRGWMVALIVVRELLVAGLRLAALERRGGRIVVGVGRLLGSRRQRLQIGRARQLVVHVRPTGLFP